MAEMGDPRTTTPDPRASKVVQGLIRELSSKRWHMDAARNLALEELRTLKISPDRLDLILRRAAEAKSKEGLIDQLRLFADSLEPKTVHSARPILLSRLAVRKADLSEDRYVLVATDDIVFAFSRGALSLQQALISAPWTRQQIFHADRIYLRTSRGGPFVTQFKSLSELQARLDAEKFFALHKSVLVNIQKLTEIDLSGRLKQVGVSLTNGSVEWLTVSRRAVRILRPLLGLPSRG